MSFLLAGLLAGLGAIASTAISASAQKKATHESNETNLKLAQEANAAQLQQVQETNAFNAAEAQKARDWNEYMSNTQVQRAMADYQAAGVNPLMAVSSGGASYSSPASASGVVAQIQRAQVTPEYLNLTGISSALQSLSNIMLINQFMADRGVSHFSAKELSRINSGWKYL